MTLIDHRMRRTPPTWETKSEPVAQPLNYILSQTSTLSLQELDLLVRFDGKKDIDVVCVEAVTEGLSPDILVAHSVVSALKAKDLLQCDKSGTAKSITPAGLAAIEATRNAARSVLARINNDFVEVP